MKTINRLKELEKEIQKAQLEVDIHKRQLKEIKEKRDRLREECKSHFDCEIEELPTLLQKLEEEAERLVGKLERELSLARSGE